MKILPANGTPNGHSSPIPHARKISPVPAPYDPPEIRPDDGATYGTL